MSLLDYIEYSKKGLERERNQDSVMVLKKNKNYLFLLFDGVSSRKKSYVFIREFKNRLKKEIKEHDFSARTLSDIFFYLNQQLSNANIEGYSTLSCLFISGNKNEAYVLSIGDSRVYSFTNRYLKQITIDDSLSSNQNHLTKCLGKEDLERFDFEFKPTDYSTNFVLCSDGFYSLMENNLKEYFETFNFKRKVNIKKKLSSLQWKKNIDDSSYIIVKHHGVQN